MNILEKTQILNECYNELLSRGIIEGKTDMAIKMGVSRSALSQAFNGSEKYFTDSLLSKIRRMTDILIQQQGGTPMLDTLKRAAEHQPIDNIEHFLKIIEKKDEQMDKLIASKESGDRQIDRLIKIIENLQNS